MTARLRLRGRAAAHEVRCAECRVSWSTWAARLAGVEGGIVRLELHAEWHPGYRPRLSIRRAPRPGDEVVDGGVVGVLVRCGECGDGLLFEPDREVCGFQHPLNPDVRCVLAPHPDTVLHDAGPVPAPVHASDCDLHNGPAFPPGPCSCGANPGEQPPAAVTNTATVPDEAARAHPLHAVIAGTLRWAGGRAPADRIWGRWYGADHDSGAEGNLWAGDPDDVADLLIRAIAKAPPTEATAAAWARLRAES